jgi:hypothetical protein
MLLSDRGAPPFPRRHHGRAIRDRCRIVIGLVEVGAIQTAPVDAGARRHALGSVTAMTPFAADLRSLARGLLRQR